MNAMFARAIHVCVCILDDNKGSYKHDFAFLQQCKNANTRIKERNEITL